MALNEQPIEHRSSNFTRFTAARADLSGGVVVERPARLTDAQFAQDVAEFAAWHRGAIWTQLNGFAGYDCLHFDIRMAAK